MSFLELMARVCKSVAQSPGRGPSQMQGLRQQLATELVIGSFYFV